MGGLLNFASLMVPCAAFTEGTLGDNGNMKPQFTGQYMQLAAEGML